MSGDGTRDLGWDWGLSDQGCRRWSLADTRGVSLGQEGDGRCEVPRVEGGPVSGSRGVLDVSGRTGRDRGRVGGVEEERGNE